MARTTTVNLLLLDGTANGRIKCTINSRTGIIFKIPRKELLKCKDLDGLDNDGVYFLLGEHKIYVGQAGSRKNGNGILSRLNEHAHNAAKDFWTEAIVLTTSNNSFGATEIGWLEHKFCDMAIKAACCEVTNSNDPSPGNITVEKKSDLEDHVEFAKLILSAIGYKIFEPPQQKISPPVIQNDGIFYLTRRLKKLGRNISARMKRTSTGYKVLTGSEISPLDDGNRSLNVKNARNSAQIVNGILQEDVEFNKPSPAAEFVLGYSANGNDYWKTKDGVPLKNFL